MIEFVTSVLNLVAAGLSLTTAIILVTTKNRKK